MLQISKQYIGTYEPMLKSLNTPTLKPLNRVTTVLIMTLLLSSDYEPTIPTTTQSLDFGTVKK